jgi:malate dehydrogenase (oxaloacetate-decarboxylating)(NADP+)
MPALHSAHIASHLLQELGDGVTIGPVTVGLQRPAQIVQMTATISEIMNLAAVAALESIMEQENKVAKINPKPKKAKA